MHLKDLTASKGVITPIYAYRLVEPHRGFFSSDRAIIASNTIATVIKDMTDRRRINGPGGKTCPPVFEDGTSVLNGRIRNPSNVRPFCKCVDRKALPKHVH